MSINQKMQTMSLKFKELKSTQYPVVKMMLIEQLKKIAHEIESMMQINECVQNTKRRRAIDDVIKKCKQIEQSITQKAKEDIGNYRRYNNTNSEEDPTDKRHMNLSQVALRSIVMKQLRQSQLMITNQQLDSIVIQIQQNAQVMKEINQMVIEQGQKLDLIEDNTKVTLQNVKMANKELDEAKVLANKTRMLKIRMAISGVFAGLGYKILGLPGALFGMLFGFKSTS